jgi:hypothetical protein
MNSSLVMRPMRPAEAAAVRRLAYLDSSRPLRGDVLVALVDDRPVAAASLSDGRVVADPFERTDDIVELLREYADGLRSARATAHRRRRSPRLRVGLAY